ncbi:MAG: hypothetical protein JXR78_13105 [Victivallales bacterium]|nr:hypothetical protein [Victivallales bacterium]
MKVLIPTKLDKAAAKLLTDNGYEVVQDADKALEQLVAENPDTKVLIVRSEKVTSETIDSLPELRLVVRAGAGYNTIDTKYARRKHVDVMNTPGANSNAVAEEVVAMMLAAARHIVKGDITTRAGQWAKKDMMGFELTGKTMGIIGLGNIGRLLVKRLNGFDMKIMAFDPVISATLAKQLNVELCSVEEIFSKADFISLHVPENDDTKGMVNKRLFDMMKNGAMIINCARAGVINENDLREARKNKRIYFCNDVYPKDAEGEKTCADIADLMLPHLGASTVEANFNAAMRSAEQTIAYFEKGVTNCVVNKGVPDGLDEQYQSLAYAITSLARHYLGENRPPHKVETSFYGNLKPYAEWMLAPITAGISNEFDPYLDSQDARSFLESRGIDYKNREANEAKNYGESMTIDLFEGSDNITQVSVRGTIAENNLMIARLNNFDKLYLEPTGHTLFVEYTDEPGVIGKIASILGDKSINIIDLRAPQDLKSNRSLAVIKTNVKVPDEVISKIKITVRANVAFCFSYA